jgi:exopolyphosphatase/guanosine-5'-triphosphate,3'-diphosphate pyrophosphatase
MKQPEDVLKEAQTLLLTFDLKLEHPIQVRKLCLELIRELRAISRLSLADQTLLEAAALVHDTGWARTSTGKGHHKHSAAIVREHPWQTLDRKEVEILALIARYHRKSAPDLSDLEFASLSPKHRACVERCAAILRIADALDRSHTGAVRAIKVDCGKQSALFAIASDFGAEAEAYGFYKKKDLFEKHFKRSAQLEVRAS